MAIGDIVATLSVSGASGPETFELVQNPGGYFAISGAEVVQAVDLPPGVYSIGVEATTANGAARQFVIQHTAPPSGVFSLGVNIVGAQNVFPQFPTAAAINYYAGKNIKKFRFAIGWSQVNNQSPFTGLVGIQPTAFGPLDTTSTVYGGVSYVDAMNGVISAAISAGTKVLIDVHMFGNGPGGVVGSTACPTTAFADLWGKIADYYVHTRPDLLPGIYGLDMMNEWPNGFDSSVVFTASQQAITAIRNAGYTGPIYVEGTNFTSAWNWVSGQGNPFNNSNLFQLVDPLNNLISSAHMYPDPDDSGSETTSFSYSVSLGIAGVAPPGLNLNPTIGVTRITREWLPWLVQHGLRGHLGEHGCSTDSPWAQGLFDYADWNTVTRNLMVVLQANNIEFSIWAAGNGGAGYGPNGYGYSLDPFKSDLSGTFDFSATGIQEPVWTVLDDFTGYSGPQPQAYALFQPGLNNPALYGSAGAPSQPFTMYYGGKITSPVTITPHDYLADGTTPAGGTFTPAAVTLAVGDNALATFTYTASQANTLTIETTNSAGWHDPPPIGFATLTDDFQTALHKSNMIALRRIVAPYIGPAIRLILPADGVTQKDFFFNNRGDLPRQAIQNWAGSRLIPIARIYSQNGNSAGDFIPIAASQFFTPSLSNPPILSLVNSAGYPEVTVVNGQWMGTQSASNGLGLLTLAARAAGTGALITQANFNNIFQLSSGFGFTVSPNGGGSPIVSIGSFSSYTTIGGTYSNLRSTNNVNGYNSGSVVGSASVAPFTFAPTNGDAETFINAFRFGGQDFNGAWQEIVITFDELSPTVMAAINTDNNTYYSTALPDSLSGVNPTVTGAGARGCIVSKTSVPFAGVTIADTNGGGVTDSVTLTLTGSSGGTLSGTGLSGTGPYTIASGTAAAVTTTLQALVFTPSGAAGTSTTVTIAVTSSAGTSASNSSTVISVQAVAPAETAFAAPSGTFTPINKSGPNIIAAQGGYPDTGGFNHIYPPNSEIDYWASVGMGSIRVPLNQGRLQPACYGPLDPAGRTDGDINNYVSYPPGTQVNLAEIKRVLDRARTHNMYVQLEFHQNVIGDTQNNVVRTLGNDTEATNIAVDLWKRMATVFKNYDNAIFEYFNEPVASTAALNFTCQTTIAAAVAAITTLQWNYIPTNFFSGGNTYVSRGEPTSWNTWTPPAGLKWALVLHQYLNAANDGFTADVVSGKGASALSAAVTSMRAAGIKAVLTETGWSPSDTIVSPGTGVPSTEGNAILAFCKTNNDVVIGWNYWLGGDFVFEGPWNAAGHSVFSAVPAGLQAGTTIIDAPQVAIMQANFV